MKLLHKRISANCLTWSLRIMLRLSSASTRASPVSMQWRQKKAYQRSCHSHTQRRRSAPASTCSKLKTTRNKSSSRMHQRASWLVLSTTHSQPPKLIQSSSIVAIRMASPWRTGYLETSAPAKTALSASRTKKSGSIIRTMKVKMSMRSALN